MHFASTLVELPNLIAPCSSRDQLLRPRLAMPCPLPAHLPKVLRHYCPVKHEQLACCALVEDATEVDRQSLRMCAGRQKDQTMDGPDHLRVSRLAFVLFANMRVLCSEDATGEFKNAGP